MTELDVNLLSDEYAVRRLGERDIPQMLALCRSNPLYYKHRGEQPSEETLREDMRVTPPNTPAERKYFVGFFEGETLAAMMDLIEGYPEEDIAFIGLFMMDASRQNVGAGSRIISDVIDHLGKNDITAVRLGIDKGNPQSTHFWLKNGFAVLREIEQEQGTLLYAERKL